MSFEILKRELVALGMLEKIKRYEKFSTQTLCRSNRVRFDELALNIASLDKLISAAELEMSASRCLSGLSQHVLEVNLKYLDALWDLRRQNIQSQNELDEELRKLEMHLLKCDAQQKLAEDSSLTKRGLVNEKLLRLSEEK